MFNITGKPQRLTIALMLCLSVSHTSAENLFGDWGNKVQCARELIVPHGSKRFAPFTISDGWLSHGEVWCRLTWLSHQLSAEWKVFAVAHALCGEDDARDHEKKGHPLLIVQNEKPVREFF